MLRFLPAAEPPGQVTWRQSARSLLQFTNRDIEMRRVHDALPLKLKPYAVFMRAREVHPELHLRTAIRLEGMRVNQIDQIVAGGEHVRPCAEIKLHSLGWFEM